MNWLLTLILLSCIFSWIFTMRYQNQIIELRESHEKDKEDWNKQITELTYNLLESENKRRDLEKRL